MPHSDSSFQWALRRLTTAIPFSCSTSESSNAVSKDVLGILLRSSLVSGSRSTTLRRAMDPLPENLRQLANDCVTSARRLSQICAASGRVDYDESNRLVKSWEATHEEQARAWANDFASVYAVTRDSTSITPTRPIEMQKKPVFNREYTPLLEKYFEFNAYPSAPDRAFLARKSMMSPRQIEVWFQNHRNRARKEGKCLRKLTDHSLPPELTLELSLKSLEEKMPYFTIPVSERQSIQLKEFCGSSILDDDSDLPALKHSPRNEAFTSATFAILDPPRPSYAFPTIYHPHGENPLQVQDRIHTFPPPSWERRPAITSSIPKTSIDMGEFILDFNQKLHLRAPATKTYCPSLQSWCASRVIIPCQAPHPALVQSLSSSTTPWLFEARAQASPWHASHSPPFSHPSTLTSPRSSSMVPRRKVVGLPKRTPSSASTAYRCGRPVIPEVSLVSSPSFSRTSSFGSDTSGHHYSSSSSSSTCSSGLTTPVLSHTVLLDDPCLGLKQDIYESHMPISSFGEGILSSLSRTPE